MGLQIFFDNCVVCKNKSTDSEKKMHFYFIQFLQFLQFFAENLLWHFKNRYRRAQVDENDVTFVLHEKLILGVYYTLNNL